MCISPVWFYFPRCQLLLFTLSNRKIQNRLFKVWQSIRRHTEALPRVACVPDRLCLALLLSFQEGDSPPKGKQPKQKPSNFPSHKLLPDKGFSSQRWRITSYLNQEHFKLRPNLNTSTNHAWKAHKQRLWAYFKASKQKFSHSCQLLGRHFLFDWPTFLDQISWSWGKGTGVWVSGHCFDIFCRSFWGAFEKTLPILWGVLSHRRAVRYSATKNDKLVVFAKFISLWTF